MKLQPTVMAKALAELMLKYEPEPIPVPEVSEATMVDFELADLLGAPARPASFPDAENLSGSIAKSNSTWHSWSKP